MMFMLPDGTITITGMLTIFSIGFYLVIGK